MCFACEEAAEDDYENGDDGAGDDEDNDDDETEGFCDHADCNGDCE